MYTTARISVIAKIAHNGGDPPLAHVKFSDRCLSASTTHEQVGCVCVYAGRAVHAVAHLRYQADASKPRQCLCLFCVYVCAFVDLYVGCGLCSCVWLHLHTRSCTRCVRVSEGARRGSKISVFTHPSTPTYHHIHTPPWNNTCLCGPPVLFPSRIVLISLADDTLYLRVSFTRRRHAL